MDSSKRFSLDVIAELRDEIADAGANEVFALGFIDEKKIVTRINVIARGNESSVLALHDLELNTLPDVIIHNHPSGLLTPSDNDLLISSRAADTGIGSYIVDNDVKNVYVIAEPLKRKKAKALDPKTISAALEPGGVISRRLDSYEIRESQMELMQLIIQGFNEDSLVAAEAGTGVGKSFAYLLPALTFSSLNDERIIISTATITLQEQLFNKDIPLVIEGLGKKIKTLLMKGRGNYLCKRRLNESLREPGFDTEERKQTEDIARWAETSATGNRSELTFLPDDAVWSQVCSEADSCMNMHCPQRESCFVMLLRREALDARVIVVNHHLLFADLAARHDGAGYEGAVVLPPYSRIIIDEAHTIEEAATSFFSREFSRLSIYRQLGRLYRTRRGRKSGLLLRLYSMLPSNISANNDYEDKITDFFDAIRKAADDLDEAALEYCTGEGVYRLSPLKNDSIDSRLLPNIITLRKKLNSAISHIRNLLEDVPEEKWEEPVLWEIRSVLRRLDAIALVCNDFLDYGSNENDVMWIEKRGGRGGTGVYDTPWAVFNVTPIDIAPYLKDALFSAMKSVVCVSATLTTGNSKSNRDFLYWKSKTGLNLVEEREILTGVFPSPFPYHSKVLLAAPSTSPLPTDPSYTGFVDNAASLLTEISCGSALVLFTSYQALKSAHEAALPLLEKQGIRVLKQGDDDRHRLLNTFLSDESSVLFATDSFWEGVDAPGNTLRLVILCRLPFKSPNDPVFEARSEALVKNGGNPFMELSLPEAVMRFKQGFGRLMRRSSDHGAVVVLDGRLLHKRYGEFFLASLPETKTCFEDMDTILKTLEEFLF